MAYCRPTEIMAFYRVDWKENLIDQKGQINEIKIQDEYKISNKLIRPFPRSYTNLIYWLFPTQQHGLFYIVGIW